MRPPSIQDLFNFTGQTVLVTGSSQGIGAGIALRFAEAGADVVLHYHNNADGAAVVRDAVEQMGRQAAVIQADVTKKADVDRLFYEAESASGQVNVLVNNAGIYPLMPLLEMTEDDWDAMLNANLRSVFLCTQTAARQMMQQGEGVKAIINVASIEGLHPGAAHSHYAAAKSAVLTHTRAAAYELGPYDIRVNAVSPGLIYREGIEENWPEGVESWTKAAALGRLGTVEDIADACLFLASNAARWITGENLVVDGGVNARPLF